MRTAGQKCCVRPTPAARSRRYVVRLTVLSLLIPATLPLTARSDEADVAHVSPKGPVDGPVTLPEIARYRSLPWRMNLEPGFPPVVSPRELDADLIPLFIRVLEEPGDPEVLYHAAQSLARIAGSEGRDISAALPVLRQKLTEPADSRTHHACAVALVAADDRAAASILLEQLQTADESERLVIEPALARWGNQNVTAVWQQRLSDPRATTVSYRLATQGVAALGVTEAVPVLADRAGDVSVPFGKRAASADALSQLDAARGRDVAAPLMTGSLQDRLICVRLLAAPDRSSTQELARLCSDPQDAVAAAAWEAVFRLDSELLLPLLDEGRRHRDAVVRITAARTMELYANPERTRWLDELTNDVHLQVRNIGRDMLRQVAEEHADLHDQIVAQAVDRLHGDAEEWQGIEQALLLLGQLEQTTFSPDCLPLLRHPRPEVYVTAAWLIHLFPDDAVRDDLETVVREQEGRLARFEADTDFANVGLQVGLLFHYFGLQRDPGIDDLLEAQFSKTVAGGPEKRGAAMWALGLIHEHESDSPLVAKFVDRMTDTEGLDPEHIIVRRLSALSLGRLRAMSAVPTLLSRMSKDGVETLIPQTVRWDMQVMGQPVPELPPPFTEFVSGFRLNPLPE